MTTYAIQLHDCSTITVDATEFTTRNDGSLWMLSALDPAPAKLTPVLVLARGQWRAVHLAGTNPLAPPVAEPQAVPRFA